MFSKMRSPSIWRKISLVTWNRPNDPTIYTWLDFNVEKTQKFLQDLNQKISEESPSGPKITLTHFVAKAIALVFAKYPALNGIVKWDRIYLRDSVDIFLQVAIPNPHDPMRDNLSGAQVKNVDTKTLREIAQNLVDQAEKIRTNRDPLFKKTFSIASLLPIFVLRWLVKIHEFCIYNLNLHLPALGLHKDPFGSAMVTSVGSLGIGVGLAPLVPSSRCPLIACVGVTEKKPWVENDQLTIKSVVTITFTADHRFIDGLMGSRMVKMFKEIFDYPEKYMS